MPVGANKLVYLANLIPCIIYICQHLYIIKRGEREDPVWSSRSEAK